MGNACMTKPSSFVFDVTRDNFQSLVLENSRRGPVLVNFWVANPRIALEQLLEIVRRDRGYGNDLGRKSMIALFNMLGEHPLVARYRMLLAEALRGAAR